jgi:hypothetical protein
MTEQKKTNFLEAIKAAQAVKAKVPAAKAKLIQQEKLQKQKPGSNRPTKRASGRGG